MNFCFTLKNKKEEKLVISLQNQKFESQMKTSAETRSSQLVDDAGSKNYQYSIFYIFVEASISFFSINEIKRK